MLTVIKVFGWVFFAVMVIWKEW